MPLITCEMRWLFDGALPDEVARWFDADAELAAAPRREDRYLVLPGVADMGIKEREGRVEIKGRLAKLGSHALAPRIEGRAERWCKWSYDCPAIEQRVRSGFTGAYAVVVGKTRLQRHFALEPGDLAQETAKRDLSMRGFSLELTGIRLMDDEHWSVGIEASPDDGTLLDDLLRALAAVLQGFPLPLPRSRSRSYPAWLRERTPSSS